MARAAGGTSQRLNRGPAIVRSRESSPAEMTSGDVVKPCALMFSPVGSFFRKTLAAVRRLTPAANALMAVGQRTTFDWCTNQSLAAPAKSAFPTEMPEQIGRATDPRVICSYRGTAVKSVGVISPKGGLSEELHLRGAPVIIEPRNNRNMARRRLRITGFF